MIAQIGVVTEKIVGMIPQTGKCLRKLGNGCEFDFSMDLYYDFFFNML
jgi:hypothetical protein